MSPQLLVGILAGESPLNLASRRVTSGLRADVPAGERLAVEDRHKTRFVGLRASEERDHEREINDGEQIVFHSLSRY